ncbi:MAG: hypothetical protein KA116_01330 [Proteobacteria bacterium]|nr:hypothetical protein [Pseudomonadota bacterium]
MSLCRSGLFCLALALWGTAVASQNIVKSDAFTYEGPRLGDYKSELRLYYKGGNYFEEAAILPTKSGGTTFTGLIVRLLGDRLDDQTEGLKVKRYMYHILKDKKHLGVAHGSSFEYEGKLANVFVFYDLNRSIQNIKVENLPDDVLAELSKGPYLEQFKGRKVEDFEKQSVRQGRGRRKQTSWRMGEFFSDAQKPNSAKARKAWDGIFRSVRYNAAFMDVAFFITKHPDLDEESEKINSNEAISGPEKAAEEMEKNNRNEIKKK